VAPVSALKLYRTGIKRRRGEGTTRCGGGSGACGDGNEGAETASARGNHPDDDNDTEPRGGAPPLAPPSPLRLCLLENPFYSLPLGITELAGPAGAGKTQIALSLCADCVRDQELEQNQQQQQQGRGGGHRRTEDGNQRKAVYVRLGGSSRFLQIASRRLQQMLRSRIAAGSHAEGQPRSQKPPLAELDERNVHDSLTRILVHWVCNPEELMDLLRTNLPRLLRKHPGISVVVLDGIATLFRLLPDEAEQQQQQQQQQNDDTKTNDDDNEARGFGGGGGTGSNPWQHRAATFFQISNLCKELSSRFEVPFVVLNECTSKIPAGIATGGAPAGRWDSTVRYRRQQQQQKRGPNAASEPALGLAWSQCVNCSFFVRRANEADDSNSCFYGTQNDPHRRNHPFPAATTSRHNNTITGGVCSRVLECLRAPHVSSDHSVAEFWIGRSGVVPMLRSFHRS